MSSFFDRFKGRREPTSAEIAKERLKLVLVTDRSDLSPEKLRALQADILDVIKRYLAIDEMEVQIKLEQRDRKNYLVADIPLHRDHAYAHLPPDEMDSQSAATQADHISDTLAEPAPAEAAEAQDEDEVEDAEPDVDELDLDEPDDAKDKPALE